eukprot:6196155-Pleurochrysis_carterae.AAC.1
MDDGEEASMLATIPLGTKDEGTSSVRRVLSWESARVSLSFSDKTRHSCLSTPSARVLLSL